MSGHTQTMIRNALTVDVEEHFQVSAFAPLIPTNTWDQWQSRVAPNTRRVLALLERSGTRATFFVLGWVAERHPGLIREIVAGGHELASHGWRHQRASEQDREAFFQDVERTRKLLEDQGQVAVAGYRAASYSIGPGNLWALEELARAGYRYSSSIYPIRHDHYGMPEAPRTPHHHRPGGVVDIPVATLAWGGRRIPCGGGGYFRLFPYALSRWMIQRLNQREGLPAVFFFHPWELDPDQPRPAGMPLKTRFRHYLNLSRMESRLERLLGDCAWDRMDRVFAEAIATSPPREAAP